MADRDEAGGNTGDGEEINDPQKNDYEEEEEEEEEGDGGEGVDDLEAAKSNATDQEAEEEKVGEDEEQGEKKEREEEEYGEEDSDMETSVYSFPPAGCVDPIQVTPQAIMELDGATDQPADYPEAASVEGVDDYPLPDTTADELTVDELDRDEVSPSAPPDDPEDVNLFPSMDEADDRPVDFGRDFQDNGEDLRAMYGPGESDVTELVVLDPDHPLMFTFQKALKEFLQKQLDKATLQLREATHSAKMKEQERESTGVELYGCQQDLARSQMQLEKLRDDSETAKHDRELAEQELADMRKAYREKQALANAERKNNADLQTQVENLNMRLFYMEDAKDNVHADIAVMKRAAEKAEADVLRAEESKRIQDLFVDRLTEKMAKLQEDIALCSAQLTAQAEETRATKDSVMEARMEIEAITIEKKQLFQQWNSSLIGMKRRDEAHAAMLRALHLEQQQILTLEAELNGFRKDIQSEQETNEKLSLILKKCEDEMDRVRNNLNQCIAKQEDIKNESSQYMNILKQTEDALAIALMEKSRHVRHLTEIRNQIEHAFREKMKLEEEILETMRSQLTSDKAAQNTHKLIKRKRDEIKDLEAKIVITENEISKLLLEASHLQTNIDGLNKTLSELTDEYDLKNKIINQSEHEISQRTNKIKNKKGELDLLNKKLSLLKEKTGGVEISPLEAEVNALQKSIDSEQLQIAELQHLWLRDQSELVRLCKEEEAMSQAVETLKKELTVLTQKKLRIEGEISTQKREVSDVEKKIHDVQNHLVRLDTLIHKETGTEDTLANDNILRENEFMYSLKDAEKRSIEMQEKLESLKEEKERLLNSLVEAERQIMLWEKKTQLARETRAAVDMDVGQGEIHAMRMEIHRMQVREGQLKREQEKLVQDLEKTVSRRDTITTRGEALAKSKMNFVTKGSLERQMTDLKHRIKQTRQDICDVEMEERELKEHQEQTSAEISEHQALLQQHQYEAESLDCEVEKLLEQKHKNLADIISKQQKSKFYQQLKEGRYNRICKSQTALDAEHQKETEKMNNMITIVDDLKQKFPHAQPLLQKVLYSYGSRPDATH